LDRFGVIVWLVVLVCDGYDFLRNPLVSVASVRIVETMLNLVTQHKSQIPRAELGIPAQPLHRGQGKSMECVA
jgi:hypothetical protein